MLSSSSGHAAPQSPPLALLPAPSQPRPRFDSLVPRSCRPSTFRADAPQCERRRLWQYSAASGREPQRIRRHGGDLVPLQRSSASSAWQPGDSTVDAGGLAPEPVDTPEQPQDMPDILRPDKAQRRAQSVARKASESPSGTRGTQLLQRAPGGAEQPRKARDGLTSIGRNPWGDPRDRVRNPYVSDDEAAEFWESERDRAKQMPHIGSRHADQAIAWMRRTPGWSLEDYDDFFADLQRPSWWERTFRVGPRGVLSMLFNTRDGFLKRIFATARELTGPTLPQAYATAALVLAVVATLMLAVLTFDSLWWSILVAAFKARGSIA